ncbi:MAG: hypothetical protein R2827_15590 [Bdellovibrionales bacterium]
MEIFDFENYKDFTNNWVHSQPKKGRGIYRKMALHIGVNPVIISQVLNGDRHFSAEQTLEVTEFLGLGPLSPTIIL